MTRGQVVANAAAIDGWYSVSRLERLYDLALKAPLAPFVEVGTWKGRSAYVLAALTDKLHCVDTWAESDNPAYKEAKTQDIEGQARQNLARWEGTQFHRGNSAVILFEFPKHYAGLVHVDGDHTLPQVWKDVHQGWNILQPDGILCGDDYDEPDVREAVASLYLPFLHVIEGKLWWTRKKSD